MARIAKAAKGKALKTTKKGKATRKMSMGRKDTMGRHG